jgi:lysyl-tRNA synthetase class 2
VRPICQKSDRFSLLSLSDMDFIEVSSSSVRAVGYEESRLQMHIEFQDREVYEYAGVPPIVYAELLAAPSVGQYFNAHIRDGPYSCRRVSRAGE